MKNIPFLFQNSLVGNYVWRHSLSLIFWRKSICADVEQINRRWLLDRFKFKRYKPKRYSRGIINYYIPKSKRRNCTSMFMEIKLLTTEKVVKRFSIPYYRSHTQANWLPSCHPGLLSEMLSLAVGSPKYTYVYGTIRWPFVYCTQPWSPACHFQPVSWAAFKRAQR